MPLLRYTKLFFESLVDSVSCVFLCFAKLDEYIAVLSDYSLAGIRARGMTITPVPDGNNACETNKKRVVSGKNTTTSN